MIFSIICSPVSCFSNAVPDPAKLFVRFLKCNFQSQVGILGCRRIHLRLTLLQLSSSNRYSALLRNIDDISGTGRLHERTSSKPFGRKVKKHAHPPRTDINLTETKANIPSAMTIRPLEGTSNPGSKFRSTTRHKSGEFLLHSEYSPRYLPRRIAKDGPDLTGLICNNESILIDPIVRIPPNGKAGGCIGDLK